MKGLEYLPEALRTQDNAITGEPIFIVERLVRIYGIAEGYTDEFIWLDDESEECEKEDGVRYVGVRDSWVFVQPFLTREAAEAFRLAETHNLQPKTRVYVDSGNRNPEWKALRAYFLAKTGGSL